MSVFYWIVACIFSMNGLVTGNTNDYILAAGLFIASEIADLNSK